ncbi:MAG: LamG domain-containing protein [Bryobacterales bacterium]|nr:LamG domain-containing protein [Bryobacterales bacterium]
MRLLLGFLTLASAFAADLTKDVTFRATFDGGTDATIAQGDKRIYSAPSYKEQAKAQPGLAGTDVEIAKGAGRKGDALRFRKKNDRAVFYQAAGNVHFDPKGWTGTVSFWLSLDPETDLEPGYCDPIQVTDKAYNDSAIWTDFTKDDKPRHYRLGVFGALKSWNPNNVAADKNPDFLNRLVVMKKTPFAKGKWTHIAVVHEALGSGKGKARLYVNGQLQGEAANIKEPFEWDMNKGAIRLGVAYVGLMDDVALFQRTLSGNEVAQIAKGRF